MESVPEFGKRKPVRTLERPQIPAQFTEDFFNSNLDKYKAVEGPDMEAILANIEKLAQQSTIDPTYDDQVLMERLRARAHEAYLQRTFKA